MGIRIPERDESGREITRNAVTEDGWSYQSREIEICTADHDNGAQSYNWDNSVYGFLTHKMYDSGGVEITDPINNINAVRTQVTWSPNHDYELMGGKIRQGLAPSQDIRLSAVAGATDLGAAGIKEFVPSLNLKHVGINNTLITDGRASKMLFLSTDGVPVPTNKMEINVYYPAGIQHSFILSIELFKP